MSFRSYEMPDGREPGQPEVLVSNGTVSRLGMPTVNYDSLHEFLTDDLQIPHDSVTKIKLYGRYAADEARGFHTPFTNTIHVNAPTAERHFPTTGGVMRVIAYEGSRRSDSATHGYMTSASVLGSLVAYTAAFEAISEIPTIPKLIVAGAAFIGARKAKDVFDKHISPTTIRAMAQQQHPSSLKHEGDILFPKSYRTAIYLSRRSGVRIQPSEEEKY